MNTGIDVVIPWVDGNDPAHVAKRKRYADTGKADSNASPPLEYDLDVRWDNFDEITICLWSIHNFMGWVRRIWIITDNQTPDLSSLPPRFRDKITIVDHTEIFAGFEDVLPTFNSATIECGALRIPGLADHFILFNDDVFATGPLSPDDFIKDGKIVVRGKPEQRLGRGETLWSKQMRNSAMLAGIDPQKGF
ncbi:stealth family protein [Sulfitobacter sp. S190]|uniref:stealth family protein n=1 Tax=Sulfitobacter sp. S190 TaxID=2867022 RepID=UPI0021A5D92C|nr:stealth family protein [Sulfitobacter sp. S190]UWR22226.1 Stealth CR1 domain-containing protein [Sulfitobacter sp. S190]